jgi:AraC-like DNA-binding protein
MWGGRADYRLGQARLLVDDAAYAVLNEGRPYEVEVRPNVESFCIFFDAAAVRGALQARSLGPEELLDLPDARPFPGLFEKRYERDEILWPVLARLRSGNLENSWTLEEWDDHLLIVLDRLLQTQGLVRREIERVPALRASTREELYRRLHRARDYLEACLSKPLDLEEVARVANLSPFHFHRSFKGLFGQTPARCLTQTRMERAKHLLASTDLPVIAICHEVGYESLGSFTALFRRHTGLPPGAYRRKACGT